MRGELANVVQSLLFEASCRMPLEQSYQDDAVGILEKNQENKLAITSVVLRPRIA